MYRSKYKCSDCKHQFEKITKKFPRKDPACPKCKLANKVDLKSSVSDVTHQIERSAEFYHGGTPDNPMKLNIGGQSVRSKAIDATAYIVMKDYGMTDINIGSNLREGDNCVPKLRPELEQKVDKVFAPQPSNVMGAQSANLNSALMKQINAGIYKNQADPVRRQQDSGAKVPVNIIHSYRPEKPN